MYRSEEIRAAAILAAATLFSNTSVSEQKLYRWAADAAEFIKTGNTSPWLARKVEK